jgi:glyoxylase-like metal-dependent hydrolase (beta-lactamase superfamily II)
MAPQTREHGDRHQPGPKIRYILAPNPSMMTQNGTNTYLLGSGRVAVIDPGPADDRHLAAILAALSPNETISHIFVTHTHLDHSGLVGQLAQRTGSRTYGFGPATAGRSIAMGRLSEKLSLGGGEGVDHDFNPDVCLADGDEIAGEDWSLVALHTPGHLGNHMCFACDDILFSGDHVMGWSTSLISPPDGDMTDYMASLRKVSERNWQRFLPGHGSPVPKPALRLAELIAHRKAREAALLSALDARVTDIAALVRAVYLDLGANLVPAAKRNCLAHLIDLEGRNLIKATPFIGPDAFFTLL